MSRKTSSRQSAKLEPSRPLRTDFTARTVSHTLIARRRAQHKQQSKTLYKELFSMRKLPFPRTAHGALLTAAVIGTVSASAYALTDWFGGSVGVQQNGSILSVDLSQCKGPLPPGVDTANRSNVQFKVLGNPHISAADLQQRLLDECEYDSVVAFYQGQPATANSGIFSGTVQAVSDATIDITNIHGWATVTHEKTLALSASTTIYDEGVAAGTDTIHPGDIVAFTVAVGQGYHVEGTDQLANVNTVQSIFKTKYDITTAPDGSKNGFFQDSNIMPLDMYNQIHK